MTTDVLLTVNSGSSTIKFGMFALAEAGPLRLGTAAVQLGPQPLALRIAPRSGSEHTVSIAASPDELSEFVQEILGHLARAFADTVLRMVGHRIVHGGEHFVAPVRITQPIIDQIEALVPLAPLHQSQSVRLIQALTRIDPSLLQTGSFDTAFHRTQIAPARRLSLPRALHDSGVRRYGFHGLSYRHVAEMLPALAPALADKRIVIAHLGNGASLCAIEHGQSRDTSMGFSTLDGVPMSTRCGTLDPGALLYLLKERHMDVRELEILLYEKSGLLGMSALSGDTRVLLASEAPEARETLDVFVFHIARMVAALATTLQGLDGLVFTGGIGEHQPAIRAAVCARLGWLGVKLDERSNARNATNIAASDGAVPVLIIPADEERVIAEDAARVLKDMRDGAA